MGSDAGIWGAGGGGFAPGRRARLRLWVVGDVHGQWDATDSRLAETGGADFVVFVGDLGDEEVDVVERIASLRCPKVVVLGNHDAWFSFRKTKTPAFDRQLELLGEDHLGWRARSAGDYALVGARPWSWGGEFRRVAPWYLRTCGILDEQDSTQRIVSAAESHPAAYLVMIGHNGPFGLGEGRDAIFGRDFLAPFIDFGDPDFGSALESLRLRGRRIPLVAAGHMHEELRGGGLRRRIQIHAGTVFVNAAVVPRHRRIGECDARHFVGVEIEGERVTSAADLWLDADGSVVERRDLLAEAAGTGER